MVTKYRNTDLLDKNEISENKELKFQAGTGFSASTVSTYFTKQIFVRYETNKSYKTMYGSAYVRLSLKNIALKIFMSSNIKGQKRNIVTIAKCINGFLGYYDPKKGEDFRKIESLKDIETDEEYSLKGYLDKGISLEKIVDKIKDEYSDYVITFIKNIK